MFILGNNYKQRIYYPVQNKKIKIYYGKRYNKKLLPHIIKTIKKIY